MYNLEILLGIAIGLCSGEPLEFCGRFLGTCIVLYGLFFIRVMGAGDVKLIAVSMGILGIEKGSMVLFCGLLLAAIVEIYKRKIWMCGYFQSCGYSQWRMRNVRLAPYLFGGYCVVLLAGLMF